MNAVVKSVDDIPAVCSEDDLVAIFRLSRNVVRLWRRLPDLIPLPPLPMLDRQIRVSGCVVAWFLAQEAGEYYRSFKGPLEQMTRGTRRNRPPWWKFAAPHAERYWARALDGERAAVSVDELARILRTSTHALRRAIKMPDFPMPPANARPLRWTEGQVERLLWAPQDHVEHQHETRRTANRRRLSLTSGHIPTG
jgi:hypothetical protein